MQGPPSRTAPARAPCPSAEQQPAGLQVAKVLKTREIVETNVERLYEAARQKVAEQDAHLRTMRSSAAP